MVSLVQRQTGYHLVEVEVVTDWDAIIELEPDVRVGEVAQLLHGTQEWDGQLAEVGCLLSTLRSVVNIVQDRENGWARLLQLEEEQRKVRKEQRQHQEQLAKFLTQFQEEVHKVESATTEGPRQCSYTTGGSRRVRRTQKLEATGLTTIFRGRSST